MKLSVKLDRIVGSPEDDNDDEWAAVRVLMDKEEFDRTVDGYKETWSKLLPGYECGPLNLVRQILREIERGCVNK